MHCRKWSIALLIIIFCYIFYGYDLGYTQDQLILSRLTGPVQLDGLIDEPAWDGIEPLPMVQMVPNFGDPPTEKTEILIGYDDNYLYMGCRLYDSHPELIQSTSKKRDFMGPNTDWIGLILDTFNDNENGVNFSTNPSGLRLDLTIFNDAQQTGDMILGQPINISWNTFWDVETFQNDEGWFAEFRIPFSSLRFQEIDGKVVMGLIVWRWIPHKDEQSIFPAIPNDYGQWSAWKPSKAHEVVIQGIQSRKPFYVTPYLLGGYGLSNELNEAETAYEKTEEPEFELGLDVKYGLTSNLTLDVTLNTDFAQVEADDEQVNLTRFSLFFPEKRLFFQERSSNFDFNIGGEQQVFYSRRIGIHDGKPVRIWGGARIVGRLGRWDVGTLNMQTARTEEVKSENFGVLRLRRQVINANTYVGGIATSRFGNDGNYNFVYGLDGIFRLYGDDYLKVQWVQSFEDSLENEPLSLESTRISVNWERRNLVGFAYDLGVSRTGIDFEPGMGFIMRNDYTRIGNRLLYGWNMGETSPLLRHDVYLNGFWVRRNSDGETESVDIGPGWEFMTKSSMFGQIEAKMFYEDITDSLSFADDVDVPPGQYSFQGLKGNFMSPMGYWIYAICLFEAGSFYDGWRVSATLMPTWSISSDLELSGFYQYNHVVFEERGQKLNAHIARIRATWMLSTATTFSAFIQYNSAADAVITNVRFRYNPREGNDLYLVYDEGINTQRYQHSPIPPVTSNRTVLLKYTYTFQF